MKKLLYTLLATCLSFVAFSQTLPPIKGVKLDTKEDYRAADTLAAGAANYILSTPIDKENVSRLIGTSFIIKWMGGTPDFTFSLSENQTGAFIKDTELLAVYMACLTSAALQTHSDTNPTILIAMKKFVAYIDNPANRAKMNSGLKKLSEANKKGELQAYVKL